MSDVDIKTTAAYNYDYGDRDKQVHFMKLSRRSLLAGFSGSVAGMLAASGNGMAATVDQWAKPVLWKIETEGLSGSRPVQNPAVEVRRATDKTILVLPFAGQGTRDMALNTVGRLIWNSCDGKHTVKQIADCVGRHFDVQTQQAYVDCMAFLFHLKIFNAISV